MKRLFAFTLAETLIVMGIIGIVSALTLPNLNSSTGEKEKIAKVKKIYQNLDDAFGRAQAVYGNFHEWFGSDADESAYTKRFSDRLTDFLKISKDEGIKNGSSIKVKFATDELTLDTLGGHSWRHVILADGTSLLISLNNLTGSGNYVSGNSWMGWILADIDGFSRGKNELGKDIHCFAIYYDSGIVPNGMGMISTDNNEVLEIIGFFSALWIVENDNMDYLKINSSGKCPNGKILTWTNSSCN